MTMTDRQKKFPEEEVIAAVSANPPVAAPAPAPVPAPVTNYTGGYTASYAPTVTLPGGMQYTDYNANLRPSLKNERRALLASMAEFGTGGLAAYQQARNQTEQSRAASIEKAAARGAAVHAPRALGTELISEYDTLMSGLTDAQSSGMISHGREMDRIAAANAAYLDQIGAAGGLAAADFERLAARQDMLASQARAGGGGGGGRGAPSLDKYSDGADTSGWMNLFDIATSMGQDGLSGTRQQAERYVQDALASGLITEDNARAILAEIEASGQKPPWQAAAQEAMLRPAYNRNGAGGGQGTVPRYQSEADDFRRAAIINAAKANLEVNRLRDAEIEKSRGTLAGPARYTASTSGPR